MTETPTPHLNSASTERAKLRVLVGCEKTGTVRRAFREAGHEAYSADLRPADDGGEHILCDHELHLLDIADEGNWDLFIVHPVCTYLCVSGMHWTTRGLRDPTLTEQALQFVCALLNVNCPRIGLENPVGCISTRLGRLFTDGPWMVKPRTGKATCPPSQIIQPWQFGDDASKATCLWLKNLPPLKATDQYAVKPRIVNGKKRWSNQTDSGQNKLAPSHDRADKRSATYEGIARAMAEQWGSLGSETFGPLTSAHEWL